MTAEPEPTSASVGAGSVSANGYGLLLPGRWRSALFWIMATVAIGMLGYLAIEGLPQGSAPASGAAASRIVIALAVFGAVVTWLGSITVRGPIQIGWFRMAAASTIFAVLVGTAAQMNPGVGLGLLGLGYAVMFWAAGVVIRERQMELGLAELLDAAIFFVGVFAGVLQLLSWESYLKAGLHDTSPLPAGDLATVFILSMIAAGVLTVMRIVWVTENRPRPRAVIAAISGMLLMILGHLMGYSATLSGKGSLSALVEGRPVVTAGIVLFAAASIHPTASFPAANPDAQPKTGWLLFFFAMAFTAPVLTHVYADFTETLEEDQNITLAVSIVLLSALIALRIRILLKAAESRALERRLAVFLQDTADAVLELDSSGTVIHAPQTAGTLDQLPSVKEGSSWLSLFDPGDRDAAKELLGRATAMGRQSEVIRMPSRSGAWLWMEITASIHRGDVGDQPSNALGSIVVTHHDVTEKHLLRSRLAVEATTDALTGLVNRRGFLDLLDQSLKRAARGMSSPPSLLLIDLDDFKSVNDTEGHPAGDQLLRTVAGRLRETVREIDVPGRLGGDEFAVLIENRDGRQDAAIAADRLMAAMIEPVALGAVTVRPGGSIGIAHATEEVFDPEELLRRADLALYRSKERGKGVVTTFQPSMLEAIMTRNQTIEALRQALADGHLVAEASPILGLTGGAVVGMSCRPQWIDPDRGKIPRSDWTRLAHELALTRTVDKQVLRQVVPAAARWVRAHPHLVDMRVTVEVTIPLLTQDSFPTLLIELLESHGLPPANLLLEVPQDALRKPRALGHVMELRKAGVGIFISDVELSLATLTDAPGHLVSGLAVDSLALGRNHDPATSVILRAVRDLADSLGISPVVADGVHSDDVRAELVKLGYACGRGEALAPPMSLEEATRFLGEIRLGREDQIAGVATAG